MGATGKKQGVIEKIQIAINAFSYGQNIDFNLFGDIVFFQSTGREHNLKLSIVIPTLNERDNIVRLLPLLETLGLPEYEVIVVDEKSSDGTADAVRDYIAAGHKNAQILINDGLRGLSPSIVKGFSAANGEWLACMDGDLQHDPADLKKLFACTAANDMVIGSRYCNGGGFAEKWTLKRIIISRTAAAMSRLLLGVNLTDPMSGFFMVKRDVFNRERHLLNPSGFKIMLEIFFILKNCPQHYSCQEQGIKFARRHYGQSKLNARVVLQYLCQLWNLFRRRGRIKQG